MNIDRNNYEEYFLMFADNELSGEEKNIVEAFVKQHPDLEEEFLVIRQSVIKPDVSVKLEDKSFLFRQGGNLINTDNYQEIFVLYNDDELTGLERKETEDFVLKNPLLKSELTLLKRTKLLPDSKIVFPGKKRLFRKERDGKIVFMRWWKPAAAAVLLGMGTYIGIEFLQNNNAKSTVAVKNIASKKTDKIKPITVDTNAVEVVTAVIINTAGKKITGQNTAAKIRKEKIRVKKSPRVIDARLVKNQNEPGKLPGADNLTDNIVMDPKTGKKEMVVKEIDSQNDIRPVIRNDGDLYPDERPVKQENIAISDKTDIPDVFTTPYTFDENTDHNNNYAFYNITEEKFNKSKLGGFLRKVTRIIERKSPFYKVKDKSDMAVK